MKIYIASSWKNQHAVELLTKELRDYGHKVISWIENNFGENPNAGFNNQVMDFEEWILTDEAKESFNFDTEGAMNCDVFVYVGPAGKDAAAECGICYGAKNVRPRYVPMFALYAKGEDFGLMRKMFDRWFIRYPDLINAIIEFDSKRQSRTAALEKGGMNGL